MQYIRFRVWVLFAILITGIVLLFKWSSEYGGIYKNSSPIADTSITETYPRLYEAVYRRDAGRVKPFLSHDSDTVRAQAWRVLANTRVDSLEPFIELAGKQGSEAGWFALSKHPMSEAQLRRLERRWREQPGQRAGIARVLGRQGDRQSFDFLLSAIDTKIAQNDHYALALSRLAIRFEIEEGAQIKILQKAFDTSREVVRRAYLYGWYRGARTPLTATAKDTLLSRWREQGLGISPTLDQYGTKILPGRTYTVTNFYNGEQELEEEVQLSVELAKSLDRIELNSRNSLAAKILLMHRNVQVKKQVLRSVAGKLTEGGDLHGYISQSLISDTLGSEGLWLEALHAVGSVDSSVVAEYGERIDRVVEENPYLMPTALRVRRSALTPDGYLQHIRKIVDRGDSLSVRYALESLTGFWEQLGEGERTENRITKLRQAVFDALALGDRGVAYFAKPLLEQEALFQGDDFEQINRSLSVFSLPDDIEVYQQFGSLYKERFPRQARPVIDSLAALQYAPLNRSLADAGWEVDIPEERETHFRIPGWDRLWELGANPRWVLRTEKGNIVIQLNPLRAPATVSAIDSLSRAGAYEDVPFHRVVPNFVIQGGDIERRDGFGGPGFILPTEASETDFARGVAGIASAGRDTEGSQYFIMNQWSPHLNGNYTQIGKVVEGMRVVDRIEEGDTVISTAWY